MEDSKKQVHFFTNLDALLDTRLGTICKHRPKLGEFIMERRSKFYVEHNNDRMGDIYLGLKIGERFTNEEFDDWYKNRNVDTLKLSIMTLAVPTLKMRMVSIIDNELATDTSEVKLTINYDPYNLSNEEIELMKKMLYFHLNTSKIVIDFVSKKRAELTLDYFKEFDLVLLENGFEWLDDKLEEIKTNPLTKTKFLFPRLFRKPAREIKKELKKLRRDKKLTKQDRRYLEQIDSIIQEALSDVISITYASPSVIRAGFELIK